MAQGLRKSMDCSYRGPAFSSQYLHSGSQPPITGSNALFQCADIYEDKVPIYILILIYINILKIHTKFEMLLPLSFWIKGQSTVLEVSVFNKNDCLFHSFCNISRSVQKRRQKLFVGCSARPHNGSKELGLTFA